VFVGLIVDIWLYIYDMTHGQVLNKVDKGQTIYDLIQSPKAEDRRRIAEDEKI
jgi:hypothetical protein